MPGSVARARRKLVSELLLRSGLALRRVVPLALPGLALADRLVLVGVDRRLFARLPGDFGLHLVVVIARAGAGIRAAAAHVGPALDLSIRVDLNGVFSSENNCREGECDKRKNPNHGPEIAASRMP